MNYTIQDLKALYCDCEGNASGVSIQAKMEEKIQRLHEEAWFQGMVYVCVIVSLYILGLVLIVIKSGTKWHSTSVFLTSFFDRSESINPSSGRIRNSSSEGVTLPSSSRKRRSIISSFKRRNSEAAVEDDLQGDRSADPPLKAPSIKVTVESPTKAARKSSSCDSPATAAAAAGKASSLTLDSFI